MTKSNKPLTGAAAASVAKRQTRERQEAKGRNVRIIKAVVIALLVAFLALVAGIVSFDHIRDLAILGGQSGTYWYSPANLLPLTPDAMMVIGAIKGRDRGASRLTRLICRVTMIIGLLASLAGNVTAEFLLPSSQWGWLSIALAAWPVIPLLAATEMLTHTHKEAKVTQRKPDGVVALTRQIVRQAFINKLTNMKARKASTVKPQPMVPAQVKLPAFTQVDPMIKATAMHMIDLRKARSAAVVPAQRVIR